MPSGDANSPRRTSSSLPSSSVLRDAGTRGDRDDNAQEASPETAQQVGAA